MIALEVILVLTAAWLVAVLWKLRGLRLVKETLLREKDVAYSFVHDVGDVFAGRDSTDLDALLDRVLFYAQRTTMAGAGAIYLLEQDGETLRARALAGIFPPIVAGLPAGIDGAPDRLPLIAKEVFDRSVKLGDGIIGAVAELASPVLIRNPELDSRIPLFQEEPLQIHSILLAPMRFRNEVLGVLSIVNRVDGEAFTETDKNLIESLADQASVAIYYMKQSAALDEKRQMDRDLAIAHEIQTALLPREIPIVKGVNLAAFSVPARGIGGDYYDLVQVDAEHLGIIVADVSGKGISGAIVMAICRSILRTHAAGSLSPAAVLKAANAAIARDLPESMFISVLYMLFNTRTLELRVARAGHLRPVICRADRIAAVTVDSKGMAMGISDPRSFDEAIEETSVSLGRGDTVVAYTDGITEALDANRNEWTDASLVSTVQTTLQSGGNGRDIADGVQKALLEFVRETPQSDDMTLVVLQVA